MKKEANEADETEEANTAPVYEFHANYLNIKKTNIIVKQCLFFKYTYIYFYYNTRKIM